MSEFKITPALRRIVDFIGIGADDGVMEFQVAASGGRVPSQLAALIRAGLVERLDPVEADRARFAPGRVRLTAAGKLAAAAPERRAC